MSKHRILEIFARYGLSESDVDKIKKTESYFLILRLWGVRP
jgi:hypothetical protein